MKVLTFKAYYEPEKAASLYLTTNLIEDLADYGFVVELYVPMPTRGISDEVREEYKQRKIEELYDGKIKIYRFSLFKEYHSTVLRVIRYLISNVIYLYKGIFSNGIDVIHVGSTPPTMGVVATIIKKIKRVPLVYSLQDIFPDSLESTGLAKRNSLFWKIGRVIENYTYKNADKIIVISEDFKQNLKAKGVPEEKIEVIYNWVDENAVVPIERKDNILFDKLNLSRNKFYVVYAGNLGHAQNIEVILKAAQELLDNEDIKFIFFGGGKQENYYKDMANSMGLKNIRFYPLLPYSLVSYVYSLGDVSIVSCKKGLGKSAMPSKTWSIMSAATAVVANFDKNTDLQHIIEENDVGIFTSAGDVEDLKKAILKLFNERDLCDFMGKNGRDFIINNLTREIGTRKYSNIIRNVGGDINV
ncbi:glycosyltransferase family 4 protein [Peribacillus sp. V2I11]|uniref:glycosyltransferase family 4 protein n=1 Tax=Peribacillus sp. V2I11 TaxID=3042277 RepID=UPI0027886184|nr:glycosyltransferase family 4 protein [Peribacillus sp. V2I11]MDQ0883013.1 glycosyltransferase involved in cell wall biosynthesis [Peribacillus sp. V2I11]